MTFHIRPTTRADIGALSRLADASLFPADYFAPMIAPFFDGGPAIWRTAAQDGPVGFVFAEPEVMTQAAWNIRALAVGPRRQGLGRGLVRAVEGAIRAAQGQLIVIDTTQLPEQSAARALYAAEGYAPCGQIPDFFGPGEDKLTFAKPL